MPIDGDDAKAFAEHVNDARGVFRRQCEAGAVACTAEHIAAFNNALAVFINETSDGDVTFKAQVMGHWPKSKTPRTLCCGVFDHEPHDVLCPVHGGKRR